MSLNILMVEDDEIVVYLQKAILEECGFDQKPLSFNNGKQALDYFLNNKTEGEDFLVLLDINMPVMDGWQFLEAMKEVYCAGNFGLYIVMVTSSVNAEDKIKAKQFDRVIGFIEKPLDIETCQKIKSLPEIAGFFS